MSQIDFIFANIDKYITLGDDEKQIFIKFIEIKKIQKRTIVLFENEISTHVSFVVSGCLKAYTLDDNGFEHIIQFAPADWWVTDMYSFISQKPGNIFIEAIEDSELIQLSRKDQLQLFDIAPNFERYFRIITENSLVSYRRRLMDNMSLTAGERYENFCQRYPTLITRLPQKLIAAYIGVTPEFFSKMLNGLRKK
jgi:CRP-like cAMP-binding protein